MRTIEHQTPGLAVIATSDAELPVNILSVSYSDVESPLTEYAATKAKDATFTILANDAQAEILRIYFRKQKEFRLFYTPDQTNFVRSGPVCVKELKIEEHAPTSVLKNIAYVTLGTPASLFDTEWDMALSSYVFTSFDSLVIPKENFQDYVQSLKVERAVKAYQGRLHVV